MTSPSLPDLVDLAREVLGVRAVKWRKGDKFTLHSVPDRGRGPGRIGESGITRRDLAERIRNAAFIDAKSAVSMVEIARQAHENLLAQQRREADASAARIDNLKAEAANAYALRAKVAAALGVVETPDVDPPPYAAPVDGVPGRERCRPRHGSCGKTWPHSGGCNASAGPFAGQPYPPGGDDDG